MSSGNTDRKWREITDKQRRQKTFFAKWYYCLNPKCTTTMVSLPEDQVWRDRPPSSWPPESREIPSTQNKPYICKAESGGFRIHGTDGSVLLDNIETFSEARNIVDDPRLIAQLMDDLAAIEDRVVTTVTSSMLRGSFVAQGRRLLLG